MLVGTVAQNLCQRVRKLVGIEWLDVRNFHRTRRGRPRRVLVEDGLAREVRCLEHVAQVVARDPDRRRGAHLGDRPPAEFEFQTRRDRAGFVKAARKEGRKGPVKAGQAVAKHADVVLEAVVGTVAETAIHDPLDDRRHELPRQRRQVLILCPHITHGTVER